MLSSKGDNLVFLCGMPRAGTTFLYHNFERHPDIFVPFRRKTNYFSLHSDKPIRWFFDHFKEMNNEKVAIDTETLFFIDRNINSLELIKQVLPESKIIVCVRSPYDWVVSLYKQISTFDNRIVDFDSFLEGNYTLVEDGCRIRFNYKPGDISC